MCVTQVDASDFSRASSILFFLSKNWERTLHIIGSDILKTNNGLPANFPQATPQNKGKYVHENALCGDSPSVADSNAYQIQFVNLYQ